MMSPRDNKTTIPLASPIMIKRRGKILYSLRALMLLASLFAVDAQSNRCDC